MSLSQVVGAIFFCAIIKRVDLPFIVSEIVWKVDFRYSRLAFHGHGFSHSEEAQAERAASANALAKI